MYERIKELRKFYELTQQEFADRLKIARNNIAGYETGKRSPSDAVVSLICREFHCSEKWLRTGEGEMLAATTRSDEIAEFAGRILSEEEDSFKQRFLSVLARLSEDEWELLEKIAIGIVADRSETDEQAKK